MPTSLFCLSPAHRRAGSLAWSPRLVDRRRKWLDRLEGKMTPQAKSRQFYQNVTLISCLPNVTHFREKRSGSLPFLSACNFDNLQIAWSQAWLRSRGGPQVKNAWLVRHVEPPTMRFFKKIKSRRWMGGIRCWTTSLMLPWHKSLL